MLINKPEQKTIHAQTVQLSVSINNTQTFPVRLEQQNQCNMIYHKCNRQILIVSGDFGNDLVHYFKNYLEKCTIKKNEF